MTLVANGNIGGANAITVADLQSQSGNFVAAIDVDIPVTGGKLTVTQLSAGGNVQVRDTAGALSLGSVDTSNLMGGGQLAVISANTLSVNSSAVFGDFDVMLAATAPAAAVRINSNLTNLTGSITLTTVNGAVQLLGIVDAATSLILNAGGTSGDVSISGQAVSNAGTLSAVSGRDITLTGAYVDSVAGNVTMSAGRNVTIPVGSTVNAADKLVISFGQTTALPAHGQSPG